MYRITSLESPYLRYGTQALINGVTGNPTSDVVKFAILPQGVDPQVGDWKVGAWETVTGPPQVYVAKVQVGPLGVQTLAKGMYTVWIQIVDSPETIIRPVGQVMVY